MKKLIWFVLVLISVSVSAYAQSRKECKINAPAHKTTLTRGAKNPFKVNPEEVRELPEQAPANRGAGMCTLIIKNTTGFNINVFIDSVYAGYVVAGKNGAYVPRKSSFNTIHCWTSAGEYKWEDMSGCKDCKTTIILHKPE